MNQASSLYQEISQETIGAIIQKHFGDRELHEAKLLEGGLFNTTYRVSFGQPARKVVLRLGPVNRHLLMAFEQHLMEAEQYVYRLCEAQGIPCSKVLACDTSKSLIDRDYMIIDFIESIPMSDPNIPKAAKERLYRQVGQYARRLHAVTNPQFGRASQVVRGEAYHDWTDYLLAEAGDIAGRLEKAGGFTSAETQAVLALFERHRPLLRQVTTPVLVHTDLWEGNILVRKSGEDYQVAAVIDADRAVFGDVDFEFASPWMVNESFLEGYGMDLRDFQSKERERRRKIYLVLYFLIEAYVGYAEYNNPEQHRRNRELVRGLLEELR